MVTPHLLLSGALALLIALPAATAQPRFRLVGPTLLVDGRPVPVEGAPLDQAPFGSFVLTVPGHGRYVVSDRPFEGARRAGQFDGETLAFTAEGRSVRLRAAEPLLDTREPADAFVRFTPMRGDRADGRAVVTVAEYEFAGTAPLAPGRRTRGARARDANFYRAFPERERLASENRYLAGEVAALEAEMDRRSESVV